MRLIDFGVNDFLVLHIWSIGLFALSSAVTAALIWMKIHYRNGFSSSKQLLAIVLVIAVFLSALIGGYLLLYKTAVIGFNQDQVVIKLSDAGYKVVSSPESIGVQPGQKTTVSLAKEGKVEICQLSVEEKTMVLTC